MTQTKILNPPTNSDVLAALKRDIAVTLNCINVGIIQSFSAADQTATVQLALKQVVEVKPDGTKILKEHPVLLECPCVILSGGNAALTLPIAAGDECLVFFNDREMDEWFVNGGVQTPQTYRTHDISDGFALVGVRSKQRSIASYLANGVRLSFDGNDRIEIINGLISIFSTLFEINGNMKVNGTLETTGALKAGNGVSGTFNSVTVVNGIVTAGTP